MIPQYDAPGVDFRAYCILNAGGTGHTMKIVALRDPRDISVSRRCRENQLELGSSSEGVRYLACAAACKSSLHLLCTHANAEVIQSCSLCRRRCRFRWR